MKKDYYSKSIQILAQELSNFQELLDSTCESEVDKRIKGWPLEQIMNSVQNIKTMAAEVKRIKSLTLLNQDFAHFCLLLIDGSDMANHLLASDETHAKIQKQARSWKKIAAKFKPFLKNSIYNQPNVGIHLQ